MIFDSLFMYLCVHGEKLNLLSWTIKPVFPDAVIMFICTSKSKSPPPKVLIHSISTYIISVNLLQYPERLVAVIFDGPYWS